MLIGGAVRATQRTIPHHNSVTLICRSFLRKLDADKSGLSQVGPIPVELQLGNRCGREATLEGGQRRWLRVSGSESSKATPGTPGA